MKLPERLELAQLPTPIHSLPRFSRELSAELYAWRDDLTGFELGGNKIRKLEFLLAEALAQDATVVVTCGGEHSNHVRATVFAARRLGLDVVVVQRQASAGAPDLPHWSGNPLLIELAGATIRPLPFEEFEAAGSIYDPFLEAEAERQRSEGQVPYVIAEGGSTPLGTLGYFRAVEEMLAAWRACDAGTQAPDSLFLALGSGGTHAGLVLGYQHCGLDPTSVHAINVCDDEAYFQKRVGELIQATAERYELAWSGAELQIHDGHVGDGYGQTSVGDLRLYARLARTEGLLVDPCYTGKALSGLLHELVANPGSYGEKILFLHSGGALADFAYAQAFRGALEAPRSATRDGPAARKPR